MALITRKINRVWAIFLAVNLLVGCGDNRPAGPDAHEVALEFFDRLYNRNDLQGAAQLATSEYNQVLVRYGSVNAVGRYLYNMNFDQVELEADRLGIQLYREQSDTARVQISFSGTQGMKRYEALRDVVMVRENGSWRLSRVLDGPLN